MRFVCPEYTLDDVKLFMASRSIDHIPIHPLVSTNVPPYRKTFDAPAKGTHTVWPQT